MDLISYLLDNSERGLDENTLKTNAWDHFGVEVAALVIDSVGFTRTTQAKGIVYFLTQLAKSRKITNQVMDKYKPISYSFHADNCYAFFRDVDLAFNAAIELQKMTQTASIPLIGDEYFGLSIGIGFGRLLKAGSHEHYFGDEMNIASKLGEDTGSRDDILLSDNAYNSLSKKKNFLFKMHTSNISGVEFKYHQLS